MANAAGAPREKSITRETIPIKIIERKESRARKLVPNFLPSRHIDPKPGNGTGRRRRTEVKSKKKLPTRRYNLSGGLFIYFIRGNANGILTVFRNKSVFEPPISRLVLIINNIIELQRVFFCKRIPIIFFINQFIEFLIYRVMKKCGTVCFKKHSKVFDTECFII